jgi:hypothetical protein
VASDAAVLLVLKRLEDARRDGDRVLATLSSSDDDTSPRVRGLRLEGDDPGLSRLFGHAASGLVHVAAAIAACERRALPRTTERSAVPLLPTNGARSVRVDVETLGGTHTTTTLHVATDTEARRGDDPTRLAVFGAETMDALIHALERGERATRQHALRVAIVAVGDAELDARVARAARLLASHDGSPQASLGEGIYFGNGALAGELAFVFTGPAGAYVSMGRELALALPELVDSLGARMATLRDAAGWLYEEATDYRPTAAQKLWGSSYLIQLHAELTRGLLGMRPYASIGYCSGETNALFALGAWSDLDGFRSAIDDHAVYTRELCGELACVRRAYRRAFSPTKSLRPRPEFFGTPLKRNPRRKRTRSLQRPGLPAPRTASPRPTSTRSSRVTRTHVLVPASNASRRTRSRRASREIACDSSTR